jgi:hypothetical protein
MPDGWAASDEQFIHLTSTHHGIQKQRALKGLNKLQKDMELHFAEVGDPHSNK